jgi:hypothetical protein
MIRCIGLLLGLWANAAWGSTEQGFAERLA